MTNRLQVGIDFSQKRADLCLLFPGGELLEAHLPFANSLPGYEQAKALMLEARLSHKNILPSKFTHVHHFGD